MRAISGLLVLVFSLFFVACDDTTPDYRYRLTVEVETPGGLRTGSSVIEVEQNMGRSAGTGFGKIIMRRVRGEAVAVDLPGGQTLFTLLRSDTNNEWAETVMQMLAPEIEGETFDDEFDNVLMIEGEVQLPRTWPANVVVPERSAYPLLVTFGDIDDPTSVERVDPDDLVATFGEGVSLKRITVELTDDAVTTEIEERLGWLASLRGTLLAQPDGKPIGELPDTYRIGNTSFIRSDK